MRQRKLDNVVDLYIDGLVAGDLRRTIDKCVADGFRQCTLGVGPGPDSLVTWWQPLIDRYDRRLVLPLRGFGDGSAVLLHTFQSFGYREIEQVAFDIFDTADDDRITAHWRVTSPMAGLSPTGHSPIDGAHLVDDAASTEATKALILAYLDDRAQSDQYLSAAFVEHGPASAVHQPACCDEASDSLVRLLGCGNFAAALTAASGRWRCDVYRVEQGLIAEHWGASQSIEATAPAVCSTRWPGTGVIRGNSLPGVARRIERPRNSPAPPSVPAYAPAERRMPAYVRVSATP